MTEGADAKARFDLARIDQLEIAELGRRVRRCGNPGSATLTPIAEAIVDAIWEAFEANPPPVLASACLYRIRSDGGTSSTTRRIELMAARSVETSGSAAGLFPGARSWRLGDGMGLNPLVDELASGELQTGAPVIFEPQAIGSRYLPAQDQLVLRYGIKAALGTATAVGPTEGLALVLLARVAVSSALVDSFGTLALQAALAWSRASDLPLEAPALQRLRADRLEGLLSTQEAELIHRARALKQEVEALHRRVTEEEKLRRSEAAASEEQFRRVQRAMLNVIEDLSEARELLEERVAERTQALEEATKDAQRANRAKDEFIAMLGHELRNPLAPIVTAVELMKLRAGDSLVRERTIIERQAHRLGALLEDLLDVSRIARGMVKLARVPSSLADIVATAVETTTPLFEQQRHQLVVQVPSSLAVDADPVRLTQVFSNLLTNAAKYTDPGGQVTVTTTECGQEVAIAVTDTGRGIQPELQQRVFDLFVQDHQNLDRAQGGLGLGLSIVRNLVALHGGRVEVTSAGVGHGSTFTVHLPRLPAAAAPSAEPTSPRPAAARSTGSILIVDDNEDAAAMLGEWLESVGYSVRVAHDGLEGLRLAREVVFTAAILDIGLPVMDGYELARRLRELPNWRDVPLLAMTGYGLESDRARAQAAGFNHHLLKPVHLPTLEKVLQSATLLSGGGL